MTSRNAKLLRDKLLRDLIRLQPELQQGAVRYALHQEEHPIATAILGAVMVEHELETLLRSQFKRKDDETWAMLVADNGPLNSFYSKIVAGYALAIYDESMRDELHIVRNIRNVFAHAKKLIHFDDPLIMKKLGKATRLSLPKELLLKVGKPEGAAGFSYDYVMLCCGLATKLKSERYRYERETGAMSPDLAALFTPPFGGKDK